MSGILNNGNTCYVNVCIQVLYHLNDFRNIILLYNNNNIIIKELKNIFIKLSENNTINIINFIKELENYCLINNIKEYINITKQSDAQEFLLFLINIIHDVISYKVKIEYKGDIKTFNDKLAIKSIQSLNKYLKNNYSFIINLFYGQYLSIYNKSINFEPFNVIYLDINKNDDTIYDCFNNYIKNEKIDNIDKKTLFWNFPKILIICFKLYDYKKNINFPFYNLNLNKYTLGYEKNNNYNLVNIINHSGNINYGHYYMYNINNNNYTLYNDNIVKQINLNDININNTYILIYNKI